MEQNSQISAELMEMAPTIAHLSKQQLYQVPAGYFDMLAISIIQKIQQKENQHTPFTVPAGYFNTLAGSIMEKIKAQPVSVAPDEIQAELEIVAPLLNSISRQMPYQVPDAYFETTPAVITQQALIKVEATPAKVIGLNHAVRKWANYAAAASVLFIIATTSWLYAGKQIGRLDKSPSIQQRIASLNDNDIANYLTEAAESTGENVSNPEDQSPELQKMLQNTSDEELINYLDEPADGSEKRIKAI